MEASTLIQGVLVAAAVALASGCAERPSPRSPEPAALTTANIHTTCALGVRNAHVDFEETATGASLSFSSPSDTLDDLRARAKNTASMHGSGRHLGLGHHGVHGTGGGWHGVHPTWLPAATTTYEPTAEGARITYEPMNPEDVTALRNRLKARAEFLMASCPGDDRPPAPPLP